MSTSYDANKKPLVAYSEHEERAQFLDFDSMPRKSNKSKKSRKSKRQSVKVIKGTRIVKGRVSIKLGGYSGVQKLAPSQLIRYIPLNKLKAAAKKVLASLGHQKIKKKRKSKKKK